MVRICKPFVTVDNVLMFLYLITMFFTWLRFDVFFYLITMFYVFFLITMFWCYCTSLLCFNCNLQYFDVNKEQRKMKTNTNSMRISLNFRIDLKAIDNTISAQKIQNITTLRRRSRYQVLHNRSSIEVFLDCKKNIYI